MLPPTKSCPRLWGKWHEVPKGVRLKTAECRELFPISFAYAQQNAGWNMVVLQRCRLQSSLFRPILPSLHRPLGALGSNPPFHGGAFWCSTNSAYSAVPLRGAIVSMGLRGVQGGLRGEIEIFPGPPAKKVIKMLICYLFVSPPQSIAKPSPGWNKVALLTAVRNSPCSCPFSVSLHPPLAALNSEPRPGRILALFSFYFIMFGLSVRLSM